MTWMSDIQFVCIYVCRFWKLNNCFVLNICEIIAELVGPLLLTFELFPNLFCSFCIYLSCIETSYFNHVFQLKSNVLQALPPTLNCKYANNMFGHHPKTFDHKQ